MQRAVSFEIHQTNWSCTLNPSGSLSKNRASWAQHELVHTLSPIPQLSISALMKSCETQIWRHLVRSTSLERTRIEDFAECCRHVLCQFGNVSLTKSPRCVPAGTKSLVVCLDKSGHQLGLKLLKGLSKVRLALADPLRVNRDSHSRPNKNQLVVFYFEVITTTHISSLAESHTMHQLRQDDVSASQ